MLMLTLDLAMAVRVVTRRALSISCKALRNGSLQCPLDSTLLTRHSRMACQAHLKGTLAERQQPTKEVIETAPPTSLPESTSRARTEEGGDRASRKLRCNTSTTLEGKRAQRDGKGRWWSSLSAPTRKKKTHQHERQLPRKT